MSICQNFHKFHLWKKMTLFIYFASHAYGRKLICEKTFDVKYLKLFYLKSRIYLWHLDKKRVGEVSHASFNGHISLFLKIIFHTFFFFQRWLLKLSTTFKKNFVPNDTRRVLQKGKKGGEGRIIGRGLYGR